jgi:CRP-like cAMP-binding protein
MLSTLLEFRLPPALAAASRLRKLRKGEAAFRAGQAVEQIFYVQQGEIRASRHQLDGNKAVMLRARRGEFFALTSLFMPRYPCDAEAAEASCVLAMPKDCFHEALAQDSAFALAVMQATAMAMKSQCTKVERLHLKRAGDRVLHYLACEQRNGKVELHMPLLCWADELGLQPETLYRVLAELEEQGLILREGRCITLRENTAALCCAG